jgi:hypothetical protein
MARPARVAARGRPRVRVRPFARVRGWPDAVDSAHAQARVQQQAVWDTLSGGESGDLNGFEEGSRVDEAALRALGLATGVADGIKILGTGELTKRLTVSAHAFSASARAKIEALGGACELIAKRALVQEKA